MNYYKIRELKIDKLNPPKTKHITAPLESHTSYAHNFQTPPLLISRLPVSPLVAPVSQPNPVGSPSLRQLPNPVALTLPPPRRATQPCPAPYCASPSQAAAGDPSLDSGIQLEGKVIGE